jgi:hypothetical protein
VTVTQWDNVEPTATAEWAATNSLDQAYGHVIDGFALDLISVSDAPTVSCYINVRSMTSG